jgi:hypothetical protein
MANCVNLCTFPIYTGRKVASPGTSPPDVNYVLTCNAGFPVLIAQPLVTKNGTTAIVNNPGPYIFYDISTETVSLVNFDSYGIGCKQGLNNTSFGFSSNLGLGSPYFTNPFYANQYYNPQYSNNQYPVQPTLTTQTSSTDSSLICSIANASDIVFPVVSSKSGGNSGFNACTSGIAQIIATYGIISTSPDGLPQSGSATIQYFDIGSGALRFGKLALGDTVNVGLGVGSEAFGYNKGGNLLAYGAGSVVNGTVEENSIIQTGTVGVVSSAVNLCCPSKTISGTSINQPKTTCSLVVPIADSTPIVPATVGYGAVAHGYATSQGLIEALGAGSTAAGVSCGGTIQAIGDGSISVGISKCGENNIACGLASGTFGRNNEATQPYSFAFGYNSYAYLYGSMAHSSLPGITDSSHIKITGSNVITGPSSCNNLPRAPFAIDNVQGASQTLTVLTVGATVVSSATVPANTSCTGASGEECKGIAYETYTILALGNSNASHIAIPVLPYNNGAALVEVSVVSPPLTVGGLTVAGAYGARFSFLVTVAQNFSSQSGTLYNIIANTDIDGTLIPDYFYYQKVTYSNILNQPPLAFAYPNPDLNIKPNEFPICDGFSIAFVGAVPTKFCVNGQCVDNPAIGPTLPNGCNLVTTRAYTAQFNITMMASAQTIGTYCPVASSTCTNNLVGVYPVDNSPCALQPHGGWTSLFREACECKNPSSSSSDPPSSDSNTVTTSSLLSPDSSKNSFMGMHFTNGKCKTCR